MKQGDLVILRNQRKGRYHLEGGYLVNIEDATAILASDAGLWMWPADDLEPFTKDYSVFPEGNEIVAAGKMSGSVE